MANKLRKILKKTVFTGLTLYLLNAFTFPVLVYLSKAETQRVINPLIQEKMNVKNYIYEYEGNDLERVAITYLKMAHLVTMSYMKIGESGSESMEERLYNTKTGDCNVLSEITYSNFLYLINESKNNHLANYVRLASGSDSSSGLEHTWLEVQLKRKWTPYETTTLNRFDSFPDSAILNVDELLVDHMVFNVSYFKYHRTNFSQIDVDGNVKAGIDFFGCLTDYQGLLRPLIQKIKKNK